MSNRWIVTTLFCAAAAHAQQSPLVIRTDTRMVEMTVVVQDSKNQPVTGLTREDFTITDNKKPQVISIFESNNGENIRQPAAGLPAGYFSNRLEYRGGVPSSVTALLIDLVNTPTGYWGRARPHLARFLNQADPRLRLAIYVLNHGGLRVLHDFTTDTALLTNRLGAVGDSMTQKLSPEIQSFIASVGNPGGAREAMLGQGNGFDLVAALAAWAEAQENAYYDPLDAELTSAALEAIAQRMAGVPGRKNLVWLTTGFSRLQDKKLTRAADAFDDAARRLSNASVAVYPVDARGLLALTDDLRIDGFDPTRRYTSSRQHRAGVTFEPGPTDRSITMKELAARTGGRLFQGEEIDRAMPLVADHARSFYTLAYYPSDQSQDGRFRQIEVRVRRPGVSVTHRNGYYALPSRDAAEAGRKEELLSAVWAPVDATAIGLDAALERAAAAPRDSRTLALRVDGRSLLFDRRADKMVCRLDLILVQKNAEGKQVESTIDTFESTASPEKVEAVLKSGLMYRKEVRLKPATEILRVVVRNSAGALGSLSIPLPAPPRQP